jgi:hypothetical protein
MKKLNFLCILLCVGAAAPAASARGGGMAEPGGLHHMSPGLPVTGGAMGSSPNAPGTNSLGTALSSGGFGNGPQKGPLLGTNATIDREDAKVDKSIRSICRGC